MAIPTATAEMISFAELAAQSGAGPTIINYLTARSLHQVPTLALVADTLGSSTASRRPSSPR